MANQEHLDILKQGIKVWNQWREEYPEIQPDLSGTDLERLNLRGRINLNAANLQETNLRFADLGNAHIKEANLKKANLHRTILAGANFNLTNLTEADLTLADLSVAALAFANLSSANLDRAMFIRSHLIGTNLDRAYVSFTVFERVDLRFTKGLEAVTHGGPSHIGIDTIYASHGQIPEKFLRGAGIPDTMIEYIRSLVGKPIDYYTCFISYSSRDQEFAERLYADLQQKGVRCWFAPEDMKIGDNIHVRIDESIRLYDKLLLVLSAHALASTWVEREVVAAFEKEQQQNQRVLFPIRLDDTVMQTKEAWAADIRRRKHIGDFTRWKHHDDYQQAFERLLRDLKAESSLHAS